MSWTRTEAEANEILTRDPKNPIKLWIKHLCLKTNTGTKLYYYMHKLSLMYGRLTRFLMLLTLIAIACVKLGFIIAAQPKLLATIFGIILGALEAVVIFIAYLFLLVLVIFLVNIVFCIIRSVIHYTIKAIVNIVAAVLF